MKKAFHYMTDRLEESLKTTDYSLHATVINANNAELADAWTAELTEQYPEVRISQSQLGPAISVHTGEKTMGLLWQRDWQSF